MRVLVGILLCTAGLAQSSADPVLASARAAMGGPAELAAIHALSLSAVLDRSTANGVQSSDVDIDIELPGRFRRVTSPIPPAASSTPPPVRTECLDGSNAWNQMVFSPGTLLNGEPARDSLSELPDDRRAAMLREFQRLLLALRLATSADFPVEFSYSGPADTLTGDPGDEVIAHGPGDFLVRILFERRSHLPVTLTYANASQLRLSDWRKEGAVLLPHAIVDIGNAATLTLHIRKFRINPTLPGNLCRKP